MRARASGDVAQPRLGDRISNPPRSQNDYFLLPSSSRCLRVIYWLYGIEIRHALVRCKDVNI